MVAAEAAGRHDRDRVSLLYVNDSDISSTGSRGRALCPGLCTVCFFVICIRHRFNKVPGAHRGDFLYISTLTRTLAMRLGRPYGLSLDSTALAPLPAQDRMYPFGIIEVAAWYSTVWPGPFEKWNDNPASDCQSAPRYTWDGRRRGSASAATERCQPSRESEYGATR